MGPLPSAMPGRPSPIPTGLASPAPTREPIRLHHLPVLLAAWADRLAVVLDRLDDPSPAPIASPSATSEPSPAP
jgi:hypothetical protein